MKYELLGENGQVEGSRMPPDKKSKSKVTTPEKSQRLVLDLGPEAIVVELLNCLAIKKKNIRTVIIINIICQLVLLQYISLSVLCTKASQHSFVGVQLQIW